jgi:AbrB family looped-hinge helix DNA binding protein
MPIAHSRLTAQGQISVPAHVRRRLGLGPGSVIEWDEAGDQVVVRKAGRYDSADVHQALFGTAGSSAPPKESPKEGIRAYVRRRHARR